jgi:AraC family transcriptional regulator
VRTRLASTTNNVSLRAGVALEDQTLSRLADDLAREINETQTGHEAAIAAVVEQVVIHLLRNYSILRRSDSLELSRVGLVDRRIRRAIELMLAQLDQELSLKDLAAASYLSPFHFARLFKKLTGTTPHAYLAGLRTATAQKLLAETDLSITQISARVGYSSPSHFTKGFRQATGLTPRAFRASLISRNSCD